MSVKPREKRTTAGVLVMALAVLFFTCIDTSAKWLTIAGFPVFPDCLCPLCRTPDLHTRPLPASGRNINIQVQFSGKAISQVVLPSKCDISEFSGAQIFANNANDNDHVRRSHSDYLAGGSVAE
jgi:hypothetical protein